MPQNWLIDLPSYIETLSIIGGNLKHISNNAFISTYATNLKTLILENIRLSSWSPSTLVGLASLENLVIKDSNIRDLEPNVLRAFRDTIEKISITGGGTWDPSHLSGSVSLSKLISVNFSGNNFSSILNASSFNGIEFCHYLYLNSCNITNIALGAFDHLKNIKMLYLNDNLLVTIAPGLFNSIIQIHNSTTFLPKINLQNNLWYCDCFQEEVFELSNKNLLLVDPVCSHPENLQGTSFSNLEKQCNENITDFSKEVTPFNKVTDVVDIEAVDKCWYGSEHLLGFPLQIISLSAEHDCHITESRYIALSYPESNTEGVRKTDWLQPSFIMKHESFSILQFVSSLSNNSLGLLWYRSECPNELYCFNIIPDFLRMYNVNFKAKYTFCPVKLNEAEIETEKCIFYNLSNEYEKNKLLHSRPLLYIAIGLACLIIGAVMVYGIIRLNPYLLKGSKRLLFVKHRSVDALVLPPKVPLRNSLTKENLISVSDKQVYTVSQDQKLLFPEHFMRSNSVRSDKSNSPTYISALQPTEAQLSEWRIRHHFNENASFLSVTSDMSYGCDNSYDNISYVAFDSLK
jgi:hypothetical protein